MSLSSGSRLGPFEVVVPLGAGGMGEVYLARDTRVGREVALKVLSTGVAADPQKVARFGREAHLLAQLNHPNIAALYEFDEDGETRFLVLEYVPGETLAERIRRGRPPVREALETARQMAVALEAAHRRGIIHRDLKPANVKVTPDGRLKLLDFGLAKALEGESSPATPPDGISAADTHEGLVVGTAAYMSPEQARGLTLDPRTDLWSFGCVLFELLTGRQAFSGSSISDVLASILVREPDWAALPDDTPAGARLLLQRCLHKDAARRPADAGLVAAEIEEILSGRSAAAETKALHGSGRPRRRRRSRRAILVALALVAVAALAAAALTTGRWWRGRPEAERALPDAKVLAVLPFRDLTGRTDGPLVADGLAETVSVQLSRVPGVQVLTPLDDGGLPRRRRRGPAREPARGDARPEGLRPACGRARPRELARRRGVGGRSARGRHADRPRGRPLRAAGPCRRGCRARPSAWRRRPGPASRDRRETRRRRGISPLSGTCRSTRTPRRSTPPSGCSRSSAPRRATWAPAHAALARAYLAKRFLTREPAWADRAREACLRAERIDGSLPEVQLTMGRLATESGDPEGAVAAFRKVLARQPADVEALLGLADALLLAGKAGEAEEAARRALAASPSYWAVHNKLGVVLVSAGRVEEAVAAFRRAVELAPENARALVNLGSALVLAGRLEEAAGALRRSVAAEPTAEASRRSGPSSTTRGGSTRRWPGTRRPSPSRRGSPRSGRTSATRAAGRRRPATGLRRRTRGRSRPRARSFASTRRTSTRTSRSRASYAKTGRAAEAAPHVAAALAADPENPDVLYQAAVCEAVSGRIREAADLLRRAERHGAPSWQIEADPELRAVRASAEYRENPARERAERRPKDAETDREEEGDVT